MKRSIIFMLLVALVVAGCNKKEKSGDHSTTAIDSLVGPGTQYLTDQQLQSQVQQEIQEALEVANSERVDDAVAVIELTEKAIENILDNDSNDARINLKKAIDMSSSLTTAHPELSFIPIDVNVTLRDMVTDEISLKEIRKRVEELTDKGNLQAARHLLADLASEIEIQIYKMPVATYPDALSDAVKALNAGNHDEALFNLHTALGTLILETEYVPLPLIRAERMLAEVSQLLEEEGGKEDIRTLLDNAEYQIRFAEALGYGDHDEEFEELYEAIRDLRRELEKEGAGESEGHTERLREKLRLFKDRISPENGE